MKKAIFAAVSAVTALGCTLTAVPASAQYRDYNHASDRQSDNRRDDRSSGPHRWHNYGGQYGYNGYRGTWRTGQRYPNYNNRRYIVSDYGAYNLPPPRPGYRYYRDDSGDIVMAAIATGVIGLILGNALSDSHSYHRHY